jgi:hypothetical protein
MLKRKNYAMSARLNLTNGSIQNDSDNMNISKRQEDDFVLKGFALVVVIALVSFVAGTVSGMYLTKHTTAGRYDRIMELIFIDEVTFSFLPDNMKKVTDDTTIGTVRMMTSVGVPGQYREAAITSIADYICDGGPKPPFNSTYNISRDFLVMP